MLLNLFMNTDIITKLSFTIESPLSILRLLAIGIKIVALLGGIAYFTLSERKVMASIQRRIGPGVVGYWGLLQPLCDGLKLVIKEMIIPIRASKLLFVIAPGLFLLLAFLAWSVIPMGVNTVSYNTGFYNILYFLQYTGLMTQELTVLLASIFTGSKTSYFTNLEYSLLFILAISSLSVYPIIIAGWSSNSKYAFLGGLRSTAQMIAYEVSIGLILMPVIVLTGSLNLGDIVLRQEITGWFFIPLLGNVILFFISMLAETNRAPFDLPEAEGELVAGYNVEYASIIFAMFFLAEYCNMLFMSALMSVLFFGGWLPFFSSIIIEGSLAIKIIIFCFLFILMRAAYPRYRYDQLMNIGWKIFLPISLGLVILITGIYTAINIKYF